MGKSHGITIRENASPIGREFAEKLQELIGQTGKSWQQVADETGISKSTIYYWCSGNITQSIGADFMKRLSDYFGVKESEIIDWKPLIRKSRTEETELAKLLRKKMCEEKLTRYSAAEAIGVPVEFLDSITFGRDLSIRSLEHQKKVAHFLEITHDEFWALLPQTPPKPQNPKSKRPPKKTEPKVVKKPKRHKGPQRRMTEEEAEFAKIIKESIDKSGKTDCAIAAEIGVSGSLIGRWKEGYIPNEKNLLKIASYFSIPLDKLPSPSRKTGRRAETEEEKRFVKLLEDLIEKTGKSSKDVANELGVSPETMWRWETGYIPKEKSLLAIADYFSVPRSVFPGPHKRPGRPSTQNDVGEIYRMWVLAYIDSGHTQSDTAEIAKTTRQSVSLWVDGGCPGNAARTAISFYVGQTTEELETMFRGNTEDGLIGRACYRCGKAFGGRETDYYCQNCKKLLKDCGVVTSLKPTPPMKLENLEKAIGAIGIEIRKEATPVEACLAMEFQRRIAERGENYKDIANKTGVPTASILRWCSGKFPKKSQGASIRNFSEYLGVEPKELGKIRAEFVCVGETEIAKMLGKKIIELNLTTKSAAKQIGVSTKTLQTMLYGRKKRCARETQNRLAKFLGIELEELDNIMPAFREKPIDAAAFSEWVRAWCESGRTKCELAKIAGVSASTVSAWGEKRGPKEESLEKICTYVGQSREKMIAPFLDHQAGVPEGLRGKLCRECAKSFLGGEHSRYCPKCRAKRVAEARRRSRDQKAKGIEQKTGNLAICERCGAEYRVENAGQRYCKSCTEREAPKIEAAEKGEMYEKLRMRTEWVLLSPDGEIYEIRNLSRWCEENKEKLYNNPDVAKKILYSIRTAYKKRTFTPKSWRGWTLIEDGKPVTEWAKEKTTHEAEDEESII